MKMAFSRNKVLTIFFHKPLVTTRQFFHQYFWQNYFKNRNIGSLFSKWTFYIWQHIHVCRYICSSRCWVEHKYVLEPILRSWVTTPYKNMFYFFVKRSCLLQRWRCKYIPTCVIVNSKAEGLGPEANPMHDCDLQRQNIFPYVLKTL
jgi:hypothetical protein